MLTMLPTTTKLVAVSFAPAIYQLVHCAKYAQDIVKNTKTVFAPPVFAPPVNDPVLPYLIESKFGKFEHRKVKEVMLGPVKQPPQAQRTEERYKNLEKNFSKMNDRWD